jgi:hypothetical protein
VVIDIDIHTGFTVFGIETAAEAIPGERRDFNVVDILAGDRRQRASTANHE